MNTSFTPGPWAISPETDGTEIVAFDANPWSIRQFIARPERGNNWIANARLIAAAPDIYAALVAMLAEQNPFMLPELGGGGLPYTAENLTQEAWALRKKQALDQARAALAKVQA